MATCSVADTYRSSKHAVLLCSAQLSGAQHTGLICGAEHGRPAADARMTHQARPENLDSLSWLPEERNFGENGLRRPCLGYVHMGFFPFAVGSSLVTGIHKLLDLLCGCQPACLVELD